MRSVVFVFVYAHSVFGRRVARIAQAVKAHLKQQLGTEMAYESYSNTEATFVLPFRDLQLLASRGEYVSLAKY